MEEIEDITFSHHLYSMLMVPGDKKKMIRSLTESCVSNGYDALNDTIAGKGQGIIILLQYAHPSVYYNMTLMSMNSGPPGVGKKLTAEAMSEHLQRPLYLVWLFCIYD